MIIGTRSLSLRIRVWETRHGKKYLREPWIWTLAEGGVLGCAGGPTHPGGHRGLQGGQPRATVTVAVGPRRPGSPSPGSSSGSGWPGRATRKGGPERNRTPDQDCRERSMNETVRYALEPTIFRTMGEAQGVRRASIRYCQNGHHGLMPACPEHGTMSIRMRAKKLTALPHRPRLPGETHLVQGPPDGHQLRRPWAAHADQGDARQDHRA